MRMSSSDPRPPASPIRADPASPPQSPLERAFALARSGDCGSVSEIRKQLRAERLDWRQIEGPTLTRQLKRLCQESRLLAEADQPLTTAADAAA